MLDISFKLFIKNGIDQVSMRDIAKSAGVGEKSIYRYFGNKVELIVLLISVLWGKITKEMLSKLDNNHAEKNGYEQLESLIRIFWHVYEQYPDYILFTCDYKLYLIRNSVPLSVDHFKDELVPLRKLYVEALRKGREDKTLKFEGDPEELFVAVWGVMRGYVVKMVIHDHMYKENNLWLKQFDKVCLIILNGLKGDCE